MSVSINAAVQIDETTWRVTWSSDQADPTFFIYKNGEYVGSTSATEMLFGGEPGEAIHIEVLDDASASPEAAYPGRLAITWYATAETDHYRVEELVSSAWTLRARITDDGRGYFRWRTRFLEDALEHTFRVIAVGDNRNPGTARELTCLMVRHPDPPDVEYSYSSDTGKVSIEEA